MPGPASSAHDAFPALLRELLRRVEALEVLSRTVYLPTKEDTEATRNEVYLVAGKMHYKDTGGVVHVVTST